MKLVTVFHAIATILFVPKVARAQLNIYEVFYEISHNWECPDPDVYANSTGIPLSCVENSIPPWPLCLFHNTTYFIQASVSSASRCCDFENLEACRCPFKNHEMWQAKMVDWCEEIATCPADITINDALATETWSKLLMVDEEVIDGMNDPAGMAGHVDGMMKDMGMGMGMDMGMGEDGMGMGEDGMGMGMGEDGMGMGEDGMGMGEDGMDMDGMGMDGGDGDGGGDMDGYDNEYVNLDGVDGTDLDDYYYDNEEPDSDVDEYVEQYGDYLG